MYRDLIDQVVPLGPGALQQAMTHYPGLITQHAHLLAAIEREPSPFVRSHLRQVVTPVLLSAQDSLAAGHGLGGPPQLEPPASSAGPSSTRAAAGSSTASQTTAGSEAGGSSTGSTSEQQPQQNFQSPELTSTGNIPLPTPLQGLPPPPALATGQPLDVAGPLDPGVLQDEPLGGIGQHHPHIVGAENAPAWIFKLQFDARRIVCCSKAPVIVGWDFCNGDPELEEASRFFASID